MEKISFLANHFVGLEATGGKMTISDEGVFFKTHQLNIQNHEVLIPFNSISKIEFCNTLKIVPNGMKLILKDGTIHQFVLWKRKKAKAEIESRM